MRGANPAEGRAAASRVLLGLGTAQINPSIDTPGEVFVLLSSQNPGGFMYLSADDPSLCLRFILNLN